MFLSIETIRRSLASIKRVHVFYGTTYLVFKKGQLPIGQLVDFPINAELRLFMDKHYKPFPYSQLYYRAFRHVQKDTHWLSAKWPSSSAQSTMTRDFAEAFLHESSTSLWGWSENYVEVLRRKAPRTSAMPVPLFYLAVWLYHERNWPNGSTAETIVQFFLSDFHLGEDDLLLFDTSLPDDLVQELVFTSAPLSTGELTSLISPPPDAPQGEGGTLAYLELQGVGPSAKVTFIPAERLSAPFQECLSG